MKKSVKKYQPGGLVDSEGNPVRDGSGNPIMTGSFPDEDEITARGRAKNAEMFKSLVNRVTGRGKEAAPAAPAATSVGPAAGTSSIRDPQQMAASKASVGMDESDLRREAAANAPKRMPTRPGQSSSGIKPKPSDTKPKTSTPAGAPSFLDPQQKAQGKNKKPEASGATIQSMDTDVMRTNSRTAAKAAGASRRARAEAEAKAKAESEAKAKDKKTFGALNRTETNRAQREAAMRDDKATYKKGGSVSSASKRADGIAQRGKTRGRMY